MILIVPERIKEKKKKATNGFRASSYQVKLHINDLKISTSALKETHISHSRGSETSDKTNPDTYFVNGCIPMQMEFSNLVACMLLNKVIDLEGMGS